MGVPEFSDIINEAIEGVSDQEVGNLFCRLSEARVAAAYWKGLQEGQALTIAYLKDRLDRAERTKEANLAKN